MSGVQGVCRRCVVGVYGGAYGVCRGCIGGV